MLTPTCNGCDTISAFCDSNDMGYCRACYEEATSKTMAEIIAEDHPLLTEVQA